MGIFYNTFMEKEMEERRIVYPGFQTELTFYDSRLAFQTVIPSTGEIGRSFLWNQQSLLFFINPLIDASSGRLCSKSLATKIHEKKGSFQVLNIGCGGCADIPLFHHLLESSMQDQGINAPSIRIVNADLSDKAIEATKTGAHPYFFCDYSPHQRNMAEGEIEQVVKLSLEKFFNKGPVIESEEINFASPQDIEVLFGRKKPEYPVYKRERQSYLMKDQEIKKLIIEKADIRDLPYADNTFDVVIAHHVLKYLDEEGRKKAVSEMKRVLKKQGFIFPHYAVYQVGGLLRKNLKRVSGVVWPRDMEIDKDVGGVVPTALDSSGGRGEFKPFMLDELVRESSNVYSRCNEDELFLNRGEMIGLHGAVYPVYGYKG